MDHHKRSLGDRFGSGIGNRFGDSIGDRLGSSIGDRLGSSIGDRFDNHFNLMSNPRASAEEAQIKTAETAWQMLKAIKIGLKESAETIRMTGTLIFLGFLTLGVSLSALIVGILLR